tara:strand:- start:4320 stop:5180 length:861 start_codon:yes stop_codon:yes gene_type:complete
MTRSVFPGQPVVPSVSTSGSKGSDLAEFLNSNSVIAKIAFLLVVVFAFSIILKLGSQLVAYIYSPSMSPHLVKGMKQAKEMLRIPQDPNIKGSVPVMRSRNQGEGIEFTWSVWIFVESLSDYKPDQYKNIFYKGSAPSFGSDDKGLNFPNNAPGLYIKPNTNALSVIMNTYTQIMEEVTVPDLPLNKWVNVMIRVEGDILDVYINGIIAVRHKLTSVPKQNYGDVWVNASGGYDGLLSSLRYFNYGLSSMEIYSLVKQGPDLTMDNSLDAEPPYLSMRWYFDNANQ